MVNLLQAAVGTVFLASIYALVAVGFVIMFRASSLFNFAHGELMVLASYIVVVLTGDHAVPFWLSVLSALFCCATCGALMYRFFLGRLAGAPFFSLVILTLGLQIALDALLRLIWGAVPKPFPAPTVFFHTIPLGRSLTLSTAQVFAILMAIASIAALVAFFHFTTVGKALRIAAEQPILASQSGINIIWVFTLAWMLAALLAAIAGIVYASEAGVATADIADLGLRAFPAAVIGGFDSIAGVLPGALTVAAVENLATRYWDPTAKDIAAYGIMLVVLMFRPYGFFGSHAIDRV